MKERLATVLQLEAIATYKTKQEVETAKQGLEAAAGASPAPGSPSSTAGVAGEVLDMLLAASTAEDAARYAQKAMWNRKEGEWTRDKIARRMARAKERPRARGDGHAGPDKFAIPPDLRQPHPLAYTPLHGPDAERVAAERTARAAEIRAMLEALGPGAEKRRRNPGYVALGAVGPRGGADVAAWGARGDGTPPRGLRAGGWPVLAPGAGKRGTPKGLRPPKPEDLAAAMEELRRLEGHVRQESRAPSPPPTPRQPRRRTTDTDLTMSSTSSSDAAEGEGLQQMTTMFKDALRWLDRLATRRQERMADLSETDSQTLV